MDGGGTFYDTLKHSLQQLYEKVKTWICKIRLKLFLFFYENADSTKLSKCQKTKTLI
jgi:hypothetical protein